MDNCLLTSRMIILLLVFSVSTVACSQPTPHQAFEPILFENFEDPSEGGLAARLTRHEKLSIESGDGTNGSRALRAVYVGYHRGSERIVVEHRLPERNTTFTLSYDVKFDRDFQFVISGKLMGLGPDNKVTGGNEMLPGRWSARSNFGPEGRVKTYVYSQNKEGQYGESIQSQNPVFKKGTYHAVSLQVQLNEPATAANGIARIYVDGELVADHQNIQYRRVSGDSTLISKLLFETFHGGSTERFAPKNRDGSFATVYAFFDNIAVHRGLYYRRKPIGY